MIGLAFDTVGDFQIIQKKTEINTAPLGVVLFLCQDFCMHFHVITLLPEVCQTYTDASVLGRAQKTEKGKGAKQRGKKISVSYYNPRDFTKDKHRKVDDKPYGGGPGMVMKAEPILKAWQKAVGRKKEALAAKKVKTLIMSPRGKEFTQDLAKKYAKQYDHLVLISGRYEGIDARASSTFLRFMSA